MVQKGLIQFTFLTVKKIFYKMVCCPVESFFVALAEFSANGRRMISFVDTGEGNRLNAPRNRVRIWSANWL